MTFSIVTNYLAVSRSLSLVFIFHLFYKFLICIVKLESFFARPWKRKASPSEILENVFPYCSVGLVIFEKVAIFKAFNDKNIVI